MRQSPLGIIETARPNIRIYSVAHVMPFFERYKEDMREQMRWADTVALENADNGPWYTNDFSRSIE